jgi:hypothetical protein
MVSPHAFYPKLYHFIKNKSSQTNLSRDEELQGDSNSIKHQKTILEKYANDNGFSNTEFFVDDGTAVGTYDHRKRKIGIAGNTLPNYADIFPGLKISNTNPLMWAFYNNYDERNVLHLVLG